MFLLLTSNFDKICIIWSQNILYKNKTTKHSMFNNLRYIFINVVERQLYNISKNNGYNSIPSSIIALWYMMKSFNYNFCKQISLISYKN